LKILTPASLSITTTIALTTSSGNIQPAGDPIDDPIFPC
jgi:hypothetical protein